jgi:cytochrome c oxidase subunit 2
MNRLMLDYNVLYIVLVVAGLVFFGAIFLSTRPEQRAKPARVDAWMGREVAWFAIVIVILLGSLAATIGHTPWSASAAANRQVVTVTSLQYGFKFSTTTTHVGRQVEFHLKALDVNHGFAVYDPDGTFVAQAQMVPGYDTVLRLTFTKPGTYVVRCFEYCGIGHASMVGEFKVVRG